MSSRLEDVLLLGNDRRDRPNQQASFETALDDLEAALASQKEALRNMLPKNPIIGVPAGMNPNNMDESGIGGISIDGADMEGDDGAGDTEEEEGTRQLDDSSGDMGDVVGELEDSGEELGGSIEFV